MTRQEESINPSMPEESGHSGGGGSLTRVTGIVRLDPGPHTNGGTATNTVASRSSGDSDKIDMYGNDDNDDDNNGTFRQQGHPQQALHASSTAAAATANGNGAPSAGPSSRTSNTRRRKKQYAVSTQWERQVAEGRAPVDIHTYFCCCATRIGNMFALISYPDGTPLVLAGPCWPYCVFVTLPMILGISALVSYFFIINNRRFDMPLWLLAIYLPVVAFALIALFCVSCRNPGLMERVVDEEAGEGGWFWNEQVGSFRPPGALYCRECGVLIQDYDHLCPWTGTGIGRNNMLAFKVFVVAVNILCYTSIGIIIAALLHGIAS